MLPTTITPTILFFAMFLLLLLQFILFAGTLFLAIGFQRSSQRHLTEMVNSVNSNKASNLTLLSTIQKAIRRHDEMYRSSPDTGVSSEAKR